MRLLLLINHNFVERKIETKANFFGYLAETHKRPCRKRFKQSMEEVTIITVPIKLPVTQDITSHIHHSKNDLSKIKLLLFVNHSVS